MESNYPQQQGQRSQFSTDPSGGQQDPSLQQTQYDQGKMGQTGLQGRSGQSSADDDMYSGGQREYSGGQREYSGGQRDSDQQGLGYDQPGTGMSGAGSTEQQQQKPGIGKRMMGSAEKVFGKMTGDTERTQKGEERRSGQQF